MSYIENIYGLRTRLLNRITRGIVNDFAEDIETTNKMIQSSIVVEKCAKEKSYIDLIRMPNYPSFVSWKDKNKKNYICNVQQIKNKYDGVVFCLYFREGVAIYDISMEDICNLPFCSSKQHADNLNEKQFFVNKKNIDKLSYWFVKYVQYSDMF